MPGRGPRIVFSALDASVAGEIEGAFAAAGHIVVSNARNYRMDPLVPLLIPEVNADHLSARRRTARAKGWKGAIVTNPNCSTVVLAMALAPLRPFDLTRGDRLDDAGGVGGGVSRACRRSTSSATSCPFIGGEEEKIESETLKILGGDGGRTPHAVRDQRAHQPRAGASTAT